MKQRITIDHIGIAAKSLDEGVNFGNYSVSKTKGTTNLFKIKGLLHVSSLSILKEVKQQTSKFWKPLDQTHRLVDFLVKGPGIQQLCLAVDDLESMIAHLMANEIVMIDETPRTGAHNSTIAFVHPKSTGGILVELKQR